MTRTLSLIVCGLMLVALVGCQSAPRGSAAGQRIQLAPPASSPALPDAAPRSDQRVHILLADYTDAPVARPTTEAPQTRVALGAGDALGRQMFQRYVTVVRYQQRQQEAQPQVVQVDDSLSDLALASRAEQPFHAAPQDAWLDQLLAHGWMR